MHSHEISVRMASDADFEKIWAVIAPVIRAGETYAIERELRREDARKLWMETPAATYVAECDGAVLGTYYIKKNQSGGGAHVCNCGYMVAEAARGRGVASLMCRHSQSEALRLGFKAMQFNLVLSTNTGAIRLWERLGYEIVGTLPRAFDHPRAGLIDAKVMYKWLDERSC